MCIIAPIFGNLHAWALTSFLSSMGNFQFKHLSKDSKPVSIYVREHVVFIFVGLGYLTEIISSSTWEFHNFIFLYS